LRSRLTSSSSAYKRIGQWQFFNSYQQQGCLHKNEQLQDIEGWRLAINRSFLSTKKAWILQTITSLHTSEIFINQSQYQKYSYSTQSYFRIIFLRVLQTTISHSLSSLIVVIRSKHQISFWLYIQACKILSDSVSLLKLIISVV